MKSETEPVATQTRRRLGIRKVTVGTLDRQPTYQDGFSLLVCVRGVAPHPSTTDLQCGTCSRDCQSPILTISCSQGGPC
jgi:hypothetical protein